MGKCPNYYGCKNKAEPWGDESKGLETVKDELETVKALVSQSEDAPDDVVVRLSRNQYQSCTHVAAASKCGHKMAKTACPTACASASVVHETSEVTNCDKLDISIKSSFCVPYCSYDKDCCLDESAYHKTKNGFLRPIVFDCDNKPKYKGSCPNYYRLPEEVQLPEVLRLRRQMLPGPFGGQAATTRREAPRVRGTVRVSADHCASPFWIGAIA